MIKYILQGFKNEIEKIALSRYTNYDSSDDGGDSQFLHRKAGGSTYSAGNEYIPPSKMPRGKRGKLQYLLAPT